ncbi:MAG: histidine kinase N-terminal 7TM domain-containing protein [Spirochaetales bacterium]|nr:histidine kinase N-terminal 7TM domain-containing protein [Spirochaetales bacterium]
MHFEFTNYFILSCVSSIIASTLAVCSLRKYKVPGIKAFSAAMFIGSFWAITQGLEFMGVELSTKLFFANLQYMAGPFASILWFILVLTFTGREHWLKPLVIIPIITIPCITIVLVWLDPYLGLVRYGFEIVDKEPFSVIHKHYGIWFYIHYIYLGVLNFASFLMLLTTIIRKEKLRRVQAVFLLSGLTIIAVSNALYVIGMHPVKEFDTSPIVYILAAVLSSIGIIRFSLFRLIPLSRDFVFEQIDIGIIITDLNMNVVDINKTAENILELKERKIIGKRIDQLIVELFSDNNELTDEVIKNVFIKQVEIKINNIIKLYEFKIIPLMNRSNTHNWWAIMITDLSDTQSARQEIFEQQSEIAVLKEQQRVSRDLHDNLGQILSFNKIQLQTIKREINSEKINEASIHLDRLIEISDQTHKQIREYVYNLRQDYNPDKTFTEVIEDLIKTSFSNVSIQISINIHSETEKYLAITDKRIHLLSLTKEAVNNSLKHSGAQEIQIYSEKRNNKIYYCIADNGKGIPLNVMDNRERKTSGLKIMRERAVITGGRIQISTSKSLGTNVMVIYDENKI